MKKIRIAIVGIGNCASSLIQGLEFYKRVDAKSGFVPGIMNNILGNYCVKDIECVAAFDVDKNKIGLDVSEAIFTKPNCSWKFCGVPDLGIEVMRGPLLDGLDGKLKEIIPVNYQEPEVNVSDVLKENKVDILINYLPTGSINTTEFYAEEAICARCGFINGIPESIASSVKWRGRFYHAGLPLVGDDLKSQLGATPLHRALIELFKQGGCKINNTHQTNIGNNTDFLNLSDSRRVKSKNSVKTSALQNLIPYPANIIVDIKFNNNSSNLGCKDAKRTIIHLDGENFGSRPIAIDVELNVEDSPNGAGSMIDVIRAMKIALDHRLSGAIHPICARYFKHPPVPRDDWTAVQEFEQFIKK